MQTLQYSKRWTLGNQTLENQHWNRPRFPAGYWKMAGWAERARSAREENFDRFITETAKNQTLSFHTFIAGCG